MKFKEKLRRSSKRARVAYVVALLAMIYFFMTVIKGVYFWTDGSDFALAQKINYGIAWLFEKTWIFPLSTLWELIPAILFEGRDIFAFYKVIVPPGVVFGICMLFVADFRVLRAKFHELKVEIEKEVALREMRKDAGLETAPESVSVDVLISNATNDDPAWHNTWWGQIIIGIAIALVVAAIGLQ
ncbi:MAG: hypothetical protein KZQ95_11570 [Candidatus Thiodiazotropha sp. (ex Epidulcina cf. delphinae)]|nr:hypothetical protein [Candidatus Thiodiazotropha sp. (ex Epidulcina cf. delphinae)]